MHSFCLEKDAYFVYIFFSFWPTKAATGGVATNVATEKLLKYALSKTQMVKSSQRSGTQYL